ncbi:MAG: molybdopterin molybdotransferase MoeA [Tsuneonella sp.]
MSPPLPFEQAQQRLLSAAGPLPAERLPVAQAAGRWLAEPLTAARTQPPADLSAMDGYAMRADDLTGPWRLVGESAAGHPFAGELARGQAIRISTGAAMPRGECAVLLQEDAVREGDRIRLGGGDAPEARHIRRAGFDFRAGDQLLPAGARIGPAQLALAIMSGAAELAVGRLPTVAVIDSGDELAAPGTAPSPHHIPASNGAMLAAMAAPLAGIVERIGPVPDDLDALVVALKQAASADVIVTSGGASVGDHDLVRPALETWGATIDFWRVAMRPGKPLLVARKGEQWVLGLPGNPVSSFVTAFLFALPLLRRLAGASVEAALPQPLTARLEAGLPAGGERTEFMRGVLSGGGVLPLAERDSSALRSLAASDALIVRPIGAPAAAAGEAAQVYPLQNGGTA